MPAYERMAVELTVVIDVPADITEAEMDRRAEELRDTVENELDAGSTVSFDLPYLLPSPPPLTAEARVEIAADSLFERTRDAADREDHP